MSMNKQKNPLFQFAGADDLAKGGIVNYNENKQLSGIILGEFIGGAHEPILYTGKKNVMVMGPSRSGKGISTVIPTCLSWKDSAFILDLKGSLWDVTSAYRNKVLGKLDRLSKFLSKCFS